MRHLSASWTLTARLLGAAMLLGTAAVPAAAVAAQYQVISKSCDACGGAVSMNAQIGDTCPHCGVTWGYEKRTNGSYRSIGARPRRQSRSRAARKPRKLRKVSPQGQVRPFYRLMERGYRLRNASLIAGRWASDFRLRTESGSISGRTAEVKVLQRNFTQPGRWSVSYELLGARSLGATKTEVWVRKRTALSGAAFNASGISTERHLWNRSGGKWRLQAVQVVKSHA